ncbi:MAG: ribosomal protein S18-alanine N-acetyltransferase [Clostridia bacterium]|nr:ribosomal protein S18-alanine N-acetyltransferase [Clostridia bacterium]
MDYIDIRPMNADMAKAASDLEGLCFHTPTSPTMMWEELTKPEGIYFGAFDGQTLVGYVGMQSVLDEGYIMNLCVNPDYRRRGIARQLMDALLKGAEKAELAFVTLEVRESNVPAISLYKSLSFEEVGLRKNYYQNPTEHALLLTRFYKKVNL